MIRRSTAIVLIIFVVLVSVALYLQKNKSTETSEETATPTSVSMLYDTTAESISKVQIEKTGGSRLIMARDAQGIWSFIEPSGHEVNQDEAQSLADKILALSAFSRLEKSPSLEILGLDKPGYRIILTLKDGSELMTIIGNLTTTSSGYYASRMGQIPVIISKSSLDEILGKIDNPPIFVTQTPTLTPAPSETQIPQETPTP